MQPLPQNFLEKVAREYNLSTEQTKALVKRLSDGATEQKDAEALNISVSALRSRMTEVYTKFSIRHKGPGKLRALHDFLLPKYQKTEAPQEPKNNDDLATLVQEVRRQVKADILARCGTMRVLDMEQPIGIEDIYTSVNILEKLLGHRRLSLNQLLEACDIENFDRFVLGQIRQRRVPGLKAVAQYDKLMILGKPGAGKTTFLKRMATLCNKGEIEVERVPVFITLKEFAEGKHRPGLKNYISQQWNLCGVLEADIIELLLQQGRALILLDGLDEVQENDHDRVLNEIKDFSHQFRNCQFIITCRIAAREYTFDKFTEVEVADFELGQISEFATNWFSAKKNPEKAKSFIQRLENNSPIKELATNPLLLTLLCLVFGEVADFPANRAELYKEGLDVLLKKWDAKRNIERDQIYKNLSPKRKEDLFSKIAFHTFSKSDYFFKQIEVEHQIINYICNLPEAKDDTEALQLDSEAILKAIEAQHGLLVERARGIYSFSHLTFHEYFTAKQITRSTTYLNEALANLTTKVTEKRYSEIFLLTVGMLPEADIFIKSVKQQIDQLLSHDAKLQSFLHWLQTKSMSIQVACQDIEIRFFYLALALSLALYSSQSLNHARTLDLTLNKALDFDRGLDRMLARALALDHALTRVRAFDRILYRADVLNLVLEKTSNSQLKTALELLQSQLPNLKEREACYQWSTTYGQDWVNQLRDVMIEHRNIGHRWKFTDTQKEILQKYYDSSQLLFKCLNSDCYVTKTTRQEIEDTLLLPIDEIKKRKGQ